MFLNKNCVIEDAKSTKVFKLQMKGKNIVLDLLMSRLWYTKKITIQCFGTREWGIIIIKLYFFMKKNKMVKGLPKLENDFSTCATCQYGKLSRFPFQQSKAWRATQKLQLTHIDVKGPMNTSSLNGNASIEHQLTTPYTPQ